MKKLIIGSIFLSVFIFNMSHLHLKSSKVDANLMLLVKHANANEETIDGGMIGEVNVWGSTTYKEGGIGNSVMTWVGHWFDDEDNPTTEELNQMYFDTTIQARGAATVTIHSPQITINTQVTGGWNVGFTAEVTAGTGYTGSYISLPRDCCVKQDWGLCNHLPPCEMYS